MANGKDYFLEISKIPTRRKISRHGWGYSRLPSGDDVVQIMMSANVFFSVGTTFVNRPAVDRPQAQLVRELVNSVAGRVGRMYIDRFGSAVQKEKSAHDGAEPSHRLEQIYIHEMSVKNRIGFIKLKKKNVQWTGRRRTAISTVDGGYRRHETFVFLQLSRHHWTYCLSFPSHCKFFRRKLTKYCKNKKKTKSFDTYSALEWKKKN